MTAIAEPQPRLRRRSTIWERARFWLSVILLILCISGGGGPTPLRELIAQLLGAALLVLVAAAYRGGGTLPGRRFADVLILVIVALPLLQIVPLPPGWWEQLPGRGTTSDIDNLVGLVGIARPLSMDPDATRRAALALVPPVALFLAIRDESLRRRLLLMRVVLGCALASLAVGMVQVLQPGTFEFYDFMHHGLPVGFLANRNHQADLLTIGALAAFAAFSRGNSQAIISAGARRWMRRSLALLLLIGVVATRSRAGAVLAMAILLLHAVLSWWSNRRPAEEGARRWGRALLAIAAAAALAVAVIVFSGVAQTALARFGAGDDPRFSIWRDSLAAMRAAMPVGTGLGTFVPVFASFQSLESVDVTYVNHAHCDYLEIALETGMAGLLIVIAYLIWFARQTLRNGAASGPLGRSAALMILLLLLHSFVDYPLRQMTLVVIFALANAMLLPAAGEASLTRPRAKPGPDAAGWPKASVSDSIDVSGEFGMSRGVEM